MRKQGEKMEEVRPRIRVAGILVENNKILLIQHHKNNKKYWLIPGGGNDWGETTKQALIREYKEETNLDIIAPKLRGIITCPSFDGEKDWYTYVFTATEYKGHLTEDCNEGDLVWVKKTEIQNIKTWEGDYIFLDWLVKDKPFFSAKFNYKNNKFKDYTVNFYE